MIPTKMDELRVMVRTAGYHNSAADWENDEWVYAFSRETNGPATYGHPKMTAAWNKRTGTLTVHK